MSKNTFARIIVSGVFVSGLFAASELSAQADILSKVRQLRSEGKSEQALQLLESNWPGADQINAADLETMSMQRGLLQSELKKTADAKKSFAAVVANKQMLAENATWELLQIALQENDYVQARKLADGILKMSASSKMQNSARLLLAKMNLDQNRFRDARVELVKQEKRTRQEETYPEIVFQLARAERGAGNTANFCKWARKLYAHYPDYKEVSGWGFDLGSDIFIDRATHCSANSDDKRARIKNLQWAGQAEKAQNEIAQLKKTDPEESERLQISYLLHEGEVEQAMALLKPMYASRKGDPGYLMQMGNALAKMGEIKNAVGYYYQAYHIGPRGKNAKQALYQAAFLSYQIQDYEGAAQRFQEFMRVFASSGLTRDARWHLAWIRYLRGDYDGAYKAFSDLQMQVQKSRKAAKYFATDRLQYWMAMCLFRLNRFTDAREMFSRLANDKLLGFYALASAGRLQKIDEFMPRSPKRILPDENMRWMRFNLSAVLMPSESMDWYREVASVKENHDGEVTPRALATSEVAASASEETENEQDLLAAEQGPDRGTGADGSDDEDRAVNFNSPAASKRFARAKVLASLGQIDWARWDLYDIERNTSNREYLRTLMEQYETIESFNRSSYIGQVTFGQQRATQGIDGVRNLWEHAYPRAYANHVQKYSKEFNVPSELIWGIMRTESQYKRDVVSPVGALGLMQVMPVTAQKVAAILGEKEFDSRLLLQPEGAVKIGSKYLQRLMRQFEGNLALVAAGYNAGPHRVRAWISGFGQLEMDEFIEHIPYLETRNYVKRVLTTYNTYSRIYSAGKSSSINLSEHLNVQLKEPVLAKETWDDI